MVTISISEEAFVSITGNLPKKIRAESRPDGKGGYLLMLPRPTLNRLARLLEPGENYSDVILRVAKELGPWAFR
jgi:hypothetical protein